MQFSLITLVSTALLAIGVAAQAPCGGSPSPNDPISARLRYSGGNCNIQRYDFNNRYQYEATNNQGNLVEVTIIGNKNTPRSCYFWNGLIDQTGGTRCGGTDHRCLKGSTITGNDTTITFPNPGPKGDLLAPRCVVCFADAECDPNGKR